LTGGHSSGLPRRNFYKTTKLPAKIFNRAHFSAGLAGDILLKRNTVQQKPTTIYYT